MAFASTMKFAMKENAVMSRQRQQVHTPIDYGGAMGPGMTPTISFSCGNYGQYLNPAMYIEFTVQNKSSDTLIIDGSAYSFIDRVTLKSSGGVVHDFPYFAPFAQTILDTQVISTARSGIMSAFAGTSGADANANMNRLGVNMLPNATATFCLPLFAMGITNDSSDRLIPVGALTNLELQFTLANTNDVFSHATATSSADYQISAFKCFVNYCVIDASAQKELENNMGDKGYIWSSELWKGYEATTPTAVTSDTILVPHKSESIKSIFVAQRLQANKNKLNGLGNTSRLCNYVNGTGTFQVSIGSDMYPQIPVRTTQEAAMELIKMWHGFNVPSAYHTSITAANWVAGDSLDAQAAGSFLMGLNLEAYSNKSGVLNSGINCTGGNTMNLIMNYGAATSATISTLTFVHFDAIFQVIDGVLKASW